VAKLGQLEKLGAHTEETLSALKLIISFAQEDITLAKYDKIADDTKVISKRAVKFQGMMGCMFMFSMFGFYIYSYGTASALLEHNVNNPLTDDRYSIAEIVAVSQACIIAIMVFGGVVPIIPQIIKARVCAYKVFDVIERVPLINSEPNCIEEVTLNSKITLNKISFRYPTQIETTRDIFAAASFEIKAGESTAIVGPSGSGKSTIVQLLNRYYDPKEGGEILFDQNPIKKLSLKSLRESIGYVS
jgi:ABC-type multidrug transport system fused ATPase/permease subunit